MRAAENGASSDHARWRPEGRHPRRRARPGPAGVRRPCRTLRGQREWQQEKSRVCQTTMCVCGQMFHVRLIGNTTRDRYARQRTSLRQALRERHAGLWDWIMVCVRGQLSPRTQTMVESLKYPRIRKNSSPCGGQSSEFRGRPFENDPMHCQIDLATIHLVHTLHV